VSDAGSLATRVGQIRRLAGSRGDRPDQREDDLRDERLRTLEDRVRHLERLLEGLQDSVHRESERHAKLIGELQERS
jgi:hypothetical protein